ncbi:hypothetical protein LM599_01930 [Candidatus Acetothermia bacterium]|nr:hypothetical protein [Candidatus Acetothermia bacterium]
MKDGLHIAAQRFHHFRGGGGHINLRILLTRHGKPLAPKANLAEGDAFL